MSYVFPEHQSLESRLLYTVFSQLRLNAGTNLSFDYNLGFGFTMNWESFEVSQNTYNIALGAEQSVYIDFGPEMNYRLNNGLWLGWEGALPISRTGH